MPLVPRGWDIEPTRPMGPSPWPSWNARSHGHLHKGQHTYMEKSGFVIAGNSLRSCEKWLTWGEVSALMRLGVLVIEWEDGACV